MLRLTQEQFDTVAEMCGRWSDKSLSAAKRLIVTGERLSDVATALDMSPALASQARKNFTKKYNAQLLKEFMSKEQPATLEPHLQNIVQLVQKGYTAEQIVIFLEENGIKTTYQALTEFLGSIKQ